MSDESTQGQQNEIPRAILELTNSIEQTEESIVSISKKLEDSGILRADKRILEKPVVSALQFYLPFKTPMAIKIITLKDRILNMKSRIDKTYERIEL